MSRVWCGCFLLLALAACASHRKPVQKPANVERPDDPDRFFALGESLFRQPDASSRALAAYQEAARNPESAVYPLALYRQAQCHLRLAHYPDAKELFKSVALLGERPLADTPVDAAQRALLTYSAQAGYVSAYGMEGEAQLAQEHLRELAPGPEDALPLMRQLANFYEVEGKDREAALVYGALLQAQPLSPEGLWSRTKLVGCVLRLDDPERALAEVRLLVKRLHEEEASRAPRDERGQKLFDEARGLTERWLSAFALDQHRQARKTHDPRRREYADALSDAYRELAPNGPHAPTLQALREEPRHPSPFQVALPPSASPAPPPEQTSTLKKEIRDVITAHRQEIEDCHATAMRQHPTIVGKIVVRFRSDEKGAVVYAEAVEDTVRQADLELCITQRVKRWRFAESPGMTLVTYPFMFRPSTPEDERAARFLDVVTRPWMPWSERPVR
jgi:tetratricopeptide (TPR) repeat protein